MLSSPPLQHIRGLVIIGFVWAAIPMMAGRSAGADVTAADISRRIDECVLESHPVFVDDAMFLRRVTLDVTGRIPTVAEVHEFLEADANTRRAAVVDRLVCSGVAYRSIATLWRRAWVPQADNREFAGVTLPFEAWLAKRLRDGARYDELVAEVLTQDPSGKSSIVAGPKGFFDANQSKPENLAASGARGFLGLNLDCAQCHNHPHARWTREQFWQTAAFFMAVPASSKQAGPPRIKIPDTDVECEPVLLTKTSTPVPATLDSVSLRHAFVRWMLEDPERLMAKNAVNRLWAHFFGEAIIEPLDDLSREEFQSGPRAALLRDLADLFVASDYDVDVIVKGIVSSRAYRLVSASSVPVVASARPPSPAVAVGASTAPPTQERFLLRTVPVRGLTGEQLYDSLRVASGLPMERMDIGMSGDRSVRDAFVADFHVERTHGAERSITQALTLMNGSLVRALTTADGNRVLAALLASPFASGDDQIDTIFVAVLSRHATQQELEAVQRRFASSPDVSAEGRLGGLFWALFNSAEFCTNH